MGRYTYNSSVEGLLASLEEVRNILIKMEGQIYELGNR